MGWVDVVQMGIKQALRLTAEGFEAAPDTEPEMETSESRALRLLAEMYVRTRESDGPVFVADLAPALGLSEQEANAAWRYLRDKQLIDTFNIAYTARPNARGIDRIERAMQRPDQPAPGFGNVTYNTVHIHHMENSSLQQAGANSTQVQSIQYGEQDLSDLKRALDLLEEHFDELQLDPTASRSAKAQIGTLKAQLIDRPNPTILRESGRTLRNITEGVTGGLIATAVQPGVWQFVHDVLLRLFP
jgi:hypothetical protein